MRSLLRTAAMLTLASLIVTSATGCGRAMEMKPAMVSLALDKEVYERGEVAFATVSVSNPNSGEMAITTPDATSVRLYGAKISADTAVPTPMGKMACTMEGSMAMDAGPTLTLAPGASHEITLRISAVPGDRGDYLLYTMYRNDAAQGSELAQSDEVPFTVD